MTGSAGYIPYERNCAFSDNVDTHDTHDTREVSRKGRFKESMIYAYMEMLQ
jgi:hypothetical protein